MATTIMDPHVVPEYSPDLDQVEGEGGRGRCEDLNDTPTQIDSVIHSVHECPICLEPAEIGHCIVTKCQHRYHWGCYVEMLRHQETNRVHCAICRKNLFDSMPETSEDRGALIHISRWRIAVDHADALYVCIKARTVKASVQNKKCGSVLGKIFKCWQLRITVPDEDEPLNNEIHTLAVTLVMDFTASLLGNPIPEGRAYMFEKLECTGFYKDYVPCCKRQ
jgi:Ring finger domain